MVIKKDTTLTLFIDVGGLFNGSQRRGLLAGVAIELQMLNSLMHKR